MNGLAGLVLVALLGGATGTLSAIFREDASAFAITRGIVLGASVLLMLFGAGGFVGRIPAALRLQKVDGDIAEFRRELKDFVVFGSSMIAGLGLLLGASLI